MTKASSKPCPPISMGAALLGRREPGAIPIGCNADLRLVEHVDGGDTGGRPRKFLDEERRVERDPSPARGGPRRSAVSVSAYPQPGSSDPSSENCRILRRRKRSAPNIYGGLISLQVLGGSYRDLISGERIQLDPSTEMRALHYLELFEDRSTSIYITPIHSMIAARYRYKMTKLHKALEAFHEAYGHLNAHLGALDWEKVVPADLTQRTTSPTDEVRAAFALGGLGRAGGQHPGRRERFVPAGGERDDLAGCGLERSGRCPARWQR
jgi:hypothetical protein